MLNEENEKAVVYGLLKLPLLCVTLINQHCKLPDSLHMGVQWINIDMCFLIH